MTITRMLLLRSVSTFHVFDSVDDEELVSLEDELSSWRYASLMRQLLQILQEPL